MNNKIFLEDQNLRLPGYLSKVPEAKSWIVFAHGSGSSHMSPRNNWVANRLNEQGHNTFLFDLLTKEEDMVYEIRFNIPLLAQRLLMATRWLDNYENNNALPIGYFGASTGAAAALVAASLAEKDIPLFTVISRGGRPDLAGKGHLKRVEVPTLLMVGDLDFDVIKLNRLAENELVNVELILIPGATHLFEEPGTMEQVVMHTADWLDRQLRGYFPRIKTKGTGPIIDNQEGTTY